jgi:hypothetical protein
LAARFPVDISWKEHLYHYTRSRPGPWPGESYEEYLASLLRGDPLSGHTALDTLSRILSEGTLRASGELIRGRRPVTSWTSIAPGELDSIRHWNPALLRWTFEPYGLALPRKRLVEAGARPVIYGNDRVYEKLKDSDRFRFQRCQGLRFDWKREREWRAERDFELERLAPGDGFIFLPTPNDAEELEHRLALVGAVCNLPIVIFRTLGAPVARESAGARGKEKTSPARSAPGGGKASPGRSPRARE